MPDNIKVKPEKGTTGVCVSTDKIGNVHFPIYKEAFGIAGSTPTHVSKTDPLPVDLSDIIATAFSELSIAEKKPEIQVDSQYNTSGKVRTFGVATGSAGFAGGEFKASSGTSTTSLGAIFSDRQIISKSGQGSVARFTARFPNGAANSFQIAGPATALDEMSFGYLNNVFGSTYKHSGGVIIEELTVTVAGVDAACTTTVNGTSHATPTTGSSVEEDAHEIATALESLSPLFNFTQNGAKVVCRSILAAPETGSFSFSSATGTAAWSQIVNGVAPTRDFTAQTAWNIDKMADTDRFDPANINHYAVQWNGNINYFIQDGLTGKEVLVHQIVLTNSATTPMFSVNAFRMAWSTTNTGNTTSVDVFGTEASAFIEGSRKLTERSRSESGQQTSVGTTAVNIISVRCREVFGQKVNLGRIFPLLITGATDSAKGAVIEISTGATFSGPTNFSYVDESASIAEIDTTSNTITGGRVIASITVGAASSEPLVLTQFNEILLPGEVITISMRVTTNPSSTMDATLVWDEDV